MSQQALIHYHTHWRPSGYQPGAEQGKLAGAGEQLRSVVLLKDNPDPRRLDLLTSVRDPFEQLWVKDFYLNTALKVVVLIDSSASMGYQGRVKRFEVVHDIASQLALSVYRSGDAFGLYLASENLNKKHMLPPKPNRSAWLWVQQHLPKIIPQGRHVEGLIKAASYLPKNPCLVFVISDFKWAEQQLTQLLKKLNHHHVVPMLLHDSAEVDNAPSRGIAMLTDAETGENRFVWMRPALKQKLQHLHITHLDSVTEQCRRFNMKPFIVNGGFESKRLTHYFKQLS